MYEDKEPTEILQPLHEHNTPCFLGFTTRLVCSENVFMQAYRAPEPNFSRVRLFPKVLTIV